MDLSYTRSFLCTTATSGGYQRRDTPHLTHMIDLQMAAAFPVQWVLRFHGGKLHKRNSAISEARDGLEDTLLEARRRQLAGRSVVFVRTGRNLELVHSLETIVPILNVIAVNLSIIFDQYSSCMFLGIPSLTSHTSASIHAILALGNGPISSNSKLNLEYPMGDEACYAVLR